MLDRFRCVRKPGIPRNMSETGDKPMGLLPSDNPYDPGVSEDMSKAWKKVAKEAYSTYLVACSGTTSCDSGTCYTNAGESWGRICRFFFLFLCRMISVS